MVKPADFLIRWREIGPGPFWLLLKSGRQISDPAIVEMSPESMTIAVANGDDEIVHFEEVIAVSDSPFPSSWG